MQNYLAFYKQFHETCGHVVNSDTTLLKHYEECREFVDAFESGNYNEIIKELLDSMNTGIYAAYMNGMKTPLFFGRMVLENKLDQYKREGKIP